MLPLQALSKVTLQCAARLSRLLHGVIYRKTWK
jgi:hypothetical protein